MPAGRVLPPEYRREAPLPLPDERPLIATVPDTSHRGSAGPGFRVAVQFNGPLTMLWLSVRGRKKDRSPCQLHKDERPGWTPIAHQPGLFWRRVRVFTSQ